MQSTCAMSDLQGVEFSVLATVRRLHTPADVISRSVDVQTIQICEDQSTILAGTSDCMIHQLQPTVGEEPVRSYIHHLGAVYQISQSPFIPGIFLTASEDWTIKLWAVDKVAWLAPHPVL